MSYLVFPRVRVQAANMLSASFLMGGPLNENLFGSFREECTF